LMYGEDFVSLGAVQDLKTANSLAQSMIGNYGMGEELKVFYNENTESGRTPFLGRSLAMGDKYSDKTKEKVDDESLQLVNEAYREAYRLLFIHKAQLLQISNTLVNVETIAGDTVVAMVKESYRMEKYDEID
jgi:cell division protease FtsH